MPRKGKTNLLGEASATPPQGHAVVASAEQSETQELLGEARLIVPQGHRKAASAGQSKLPGEATRLMPQGQATAASARQPLDQCIASLQEFAVQRRALIRVKNRVLLQAMATTRRALGWYAGDDEDAREGMNKRAKSIVDKYIAGRPEKPEDAEIVAALAVQLDVWRDMMAPAQKRIALVEKEMTVITATLPGYSFVQSVPGFGAKTFAIIVGEAGDLGAYPKKGHLWKRLGLAPYQKNGVTKACSQWAKEGGLDKDDWIAAGYKRDRRADIFVCLGQCLIKGNGDGKYRTAYLARKEYERARAEASGLTVAPAGKIPKGRAAEFMSLGHIDRRAQRYMEKLAIRDLWRAWRDERRASRALPAETVIASVPVARPIEGRAIQAVPDRAVAFLPSPQPDERRAAVAMPETARVSVPVARPDEEKAEIIVPNEQAVVPLPSPQPNAATARRNVPESEAKERLPSPQPNAAEANGLVLESEADGPMPPPRLEAA